MHQVKILCTGDLHIGRTSSKCVHDGEDASAYSVRNTWARVVDCAIEHEVNLVLLSGDIADDGSNQYEAMGPFEVGVTRLSEHGIEAYLVAGNHDARVLPRITSILSGSSVQLLGRGGAWEQVVWPAGSDAPVLSLIGWSYPGGRIASLPLETLHPHLHPGMPVIAMAHTDYRGSGDDYAAVRVETLRHIAGIDLWLLGHIHAPELINSHPIILNPGSPQALDPGEPGAHGPWIVEISAGRITGIEQIPLSTVAYSAITVDLSGMPADDELLAWLLPTLDAQQRAFRHERYAPRLSCRVTLTGRIAGMNKLCSDRLKILQEQPLLENHNLYLEQIDLSAIRPAYDVQQLRARPDVIGALAGILAALDETDGDMGAAAAPFLRGAGEQIRQVLATPAFRAGDASEDLPTPEVLVKAECRRLLDALLRQEEERR